MTMAADVALLVSNCLCDPRRGCAGRTESCLRFGTIAANTVSDTPLVVHVPSDEDRCTNVRTVRCYRNLPPAP